MAEMATKEQEREALQQIREIVDSLGEGSYIGMAFEGCFELAESNIENDFGASMQQRATEAEKERTYFKSVAEWATSEGERLGRIAAALRQKTLTAEECDRIGTLLETACSSEIDAMQDAADKIVELADHPSCDEFRLAVERHRAIMEEIENDEKLLGRIKAMKDKAE